MTFPSMLAALTPTGAVRPVHATPSVTSLTILPQFGLYAAFNMIAFVMIFFLLPETKQREIFPDALRLRKLTFSCRHP